MRSGYHLSQDRAVLPAQMKVAFQGLAQLGALTVVNYQRAGGLQGLEAAHIEWHIINTEHATGVNRVQVRALLLALTNRETNWEALKTVPKTLDQLAHEIAVPEQLVQACLNNLELKEIVRKRIDPDTNQHVWCNRSAFGDQFYTTAGVNQSLFTDCFSSL
jgi:hypothetical protein